MTTGDFITALFSQVDAHLPDLPTHPHASLWPSAVGTLGLLPALNGVGHRAFSRCLTKEERALFPRLPERPRLFRLFRTHHDWPQACLASPTGLGVIDPYGLELIQPRREGRRPQQSGRTGVSNHRWMVGGTLCLVLHQWGWGGAWDWATAKVAETTLPGRMRQCEERMMVLGDTAFHAAAGDPANLKLCQRGEWQDRRLGETVLSRLTRVRPFKKAMHRGWASFQARLACTMAAFNVLGQWHGLRPNAAGFVPLSMAALSL